MVRHMTQGLNWGGVVLLAGLAGALAGCSTVGQADSTAAIATPSAAVADGTQAADGTQQASAQPVQPAGVGKAITLADATCDQIKAELATLQGDKIPQKLADFGKAKYHPTSEESIRFARYVDVDKASKDKNCAPAVKAKKQVTTQKSAEPMAKKEKVAAKPATAQAKVTTPAAVKPVKPAKAVIPEDLPAEDGVSVTVPDTSG